VKIQRRSHFLIEYQPCTSPALPCDTKMEVRSNAARHEVLRQYVWSSFAVFFHRLR
jgi:hypothetical protein